MIGLDRVRAAVSAGELAYVDHGEGPAVVLLHGFPTNADMWRNLAPLLAPRFRVLAPDLLGYGASEKPQGPDLSVSGQAKHVLELLERLGVQEFAVVGHGAGGGVAQLLALEGGVRTLVLMDSEALGVGLAGVAAEFREADPGSADEHLAERSVEEAFRRGMGHPDRLVPEELELFVGPWRAEPGALVRAARALGEGVDGVAERLGPIGVPTFLVWGEDDPWLPASLAERLQDVLPGSALALLPGSSHFVLEDAPETVAPMVTEFLRLRYLGERHAHAPAGIVPPADLGVSFDRPETAPGFPDEEE